MTPEQLQQFQQMYAFFQQHSVQQITYPLDDASKAAIGAPAYTGTSGLTPTTTATVSGSSVTVPIAPKRFYTFTVNGAQLTLADYT